MCRGVKLINSKQREHYRLIRYDYYHAGRILHLMGNFHSAGIMLGYTIETEMKAGLMEVLTEEQQNKNGTLTRSHDVRRILDECNKHGLFTNLQVSDGFLEHIHYHFQRYPSQKRMVIEQASRQNKAIGNSQDRIHYYDDLIVQLDCALYKLTSDPFISIICLALRSLETRSSRDIFHMNAHALLQFDEYAAVIRQNMPERQDLKTQIEENFSMGFSFYWNPNAPEVIPYETIAAIAKKYTSSNFQLPRWKTSNGFMEVNIP